MSVSLAPWRARLLLIPLMAAAPLSRRQEPPLLPLRLLLAKPQVLTAQLAPDGNLIAVVERRASSTAVVLRDAAGSFVRTVWADSVRAIGNVRWSGDGRWLLMLHDRGGDEGYHLFRLDPRVPGRKPVDLTPFAGAEVELVSLPDAAPGIVIVTSNHRNRAATDAYAVTLATGAVRLIARNPGDITAFAVTDSGTALAASAILRDGTFEVRTRRRGGSLWRTIYHAGPNVRAALMDVPTASDRVWIRSNDGSAFESFRALNPVSGTVVSSLASRCGDVDVGVLRADRGGSVFGEQCVAAAATFRAANPVLDSLITRGVRGGDTTRAVELESRSADGSRLLFYTHASDDPGRYALLDTRSGSIVHLFESHPELRDAQLARSEYHRFVARDGLPLSLVLTRPPGGASGPRPTVLVVHGGPWTRDALGYSGETQLLANRGYAVIQVNFRGSTGLGRAVVDAGVGQFGAGMSDDLLDAVAWGVAAGAVDPARICIVGGSYGGYAALVGLTRDASHYRCGASYAGPVDLETLIRAFPPSWQPFLPRSWYRFVGNPADSADRARMHRASPIWHVDAASAPLLLFQGANDPRVRPDQTARVLQAWRARGRPATLLYAGNEGHSFNEEITALAVNRALEEFLAQSLGGRVEAPADTEILAAVREFTAAGERFLVRQDSVTRRP
jgi:dipeptidyl aminopeptidase/acylaminoacyl peptidase